MLWQPAAALIYARLEADTGSGGLRNIVTPLVNSIDLWGLGGNAIRPPNITLLGVSGTFDEVFEAGAVSFTQGFQVDLWGMKDGGASNHQLAAIRIVTLLRRWKMADLTIDGTTWKSSQIFIGDTIKDIGVEESQIRTTYDCRVTFSRVAA